MQKQLAWWQNPAVRIGVGLIVLMLAGSAAGGLYLSQIPPEQPIVFPHNIHVGLGASCLYCHPAASWGPSAGLPSITKCWGCHQQIQKKSPELEKLADYVARNEPIPWVPVALQPDFVRFNHRPHVAAGLECQTCHGDVGKMKVAEPQRGQNMGWCLDCHQNMAPENFARLSDCSLCHY
jgi:hypothetical protein